MSFIYYLVTFFFGVLNLLFCALAVGLLRRRKPWPRSIGFAVCAWCGLMLCLFLLQAFAPTDWRPVIRRWFYFPIAVEMVWNLLFLQVLVLGGILLTLGFRWWRPVRPEAAPLSPADLSRRKFLYLVAFGAAPVIATGMGVHGSAIRYDLRVRRFDIPIANLPPELEGFTISHVSDFHSGIFCGPRRLKIITDATNDLKGDLIALTGDFINNNMGEFPDVLAAMQRLRSPYGNYLCQGNHDIIPGPELVLRACEENGLPFLFNSNVILPVQGRRLIIAGLPWLAYGYEGRPELVSRLYPQRQEGDVRILLAHHPHLFDDADSADLVLSGHTHGGQIMLGDVGFGPLFFKYWSGRYQRGDTTMIVSNGCGDWFPCRVGAPAEIGLLRLTRA